MCTREQQENALAMYDTTQSIAEVIRRLGYPSKQALYTWIANRDKPWQKPNGFRGVNTAEHPRPPSVNLKISAIRACFEEGNDVQLISAQIGYSRVKQLKDQLYEMQMEIDLLKATIDVLKKAPASIRKG